MINIVLGYHKVKKESLSSQARTKIEELMLQGRLAGKVTERDLAERLKMSRAPIREAMRELLNDGLLERTSSRIVTVRQLDFDEIEEIYRIRTLLEAQAAALAAERVTDPELNHFRKIHFEMIEAAREDDFKAYYQSNIEFHRAIHSAARSPRLAAIIEQVMKESLLLRSRGLVDQENLSRSIAEHEQMIKAFEAHDSELASLFMSRHIAGGLDRLHLR